MVAFGCSDGFGPERDELERARARWEAAALRDYRYEYRRLCFCPPLRGIVEVRDGEVVAAVDPETGEAVPEEELEPFPTVDELFGTLAQWISRDPHTMEVAYDPDLGYPRSAFFDFEFNVADEEQGFEASGLVAHASPAHLPARSAGSQRSHPPQRGAFSSK